MKYETATYGVPEGKATERAEQNGAMVEVEVGHYEEFSDGLSARAQHIERFKRNNTIYDYSERNWGLHEWDLVFEGIDEAVRERDDMERMSHTTIVVCEVEREKSALPDDLVDAAQQATSYAIEKL